MTNDLAPRLQYTFTMQDENGEDAGGFEAEPRDFIFNANEDDVRGFLAAHPFDRFVIISRTGEADIT